MTSLREQIAARIDNAYDEQAYAPSPTALQVAGRILALLADPEPPSDAALNALYWTAYAGLSEDDGPGSRAIWQDGFARGLARGEAALVQAQGTLKILVAESSEWQKKAADAGEDAYEASECVEQLETERNALKAKVAELEQDSRCADDLIATSAQNAKEATARAERTESELETTREECRFQARRAETALAELARVGRALAVLVPPDDSDHGGIPYSLDIYHRELSYSTMLDHPRHAHDGTPGSLVAALLEAYATDTKPGAAEAELAALRPSDPEQASRERLPIRAAINRAIGSAEQLEKELRALEHEKQAARCVGIQSLLDGTLLSLNAAEASEKP